MAKPPTESDTVEMVLFRVYTFRQEMKASITDGSGLEGEDDRGA
jgi:hypothetical protein